MKLQILVTTMFAADFSKVKEMNLRDVDVIIANQTDHCAFEEMDFPERNVHAVMVSTNTRGASLNRNIALAHATDDLVMFADDDLHFLDGFANAVVAEFESHPEADVIKFGCESLQPDYPLHYHIPFSFEPAHLHNLMASGAPALTARRERLCKYDLNFPGSIGPGRKYNCGEDSVFIRNLLKSPLRVFLSPTLVAMIDQSSSTWFTGYNDHYFITVGYIYAKVYGVLSWIFILRRAWKMRSKPDISFSFCQMLSLMAVGIKDYQC